MFHREGLVLVPVKILFERIRNDRYLKNGWLKTIRFFILPTLFLTLLKFDGWGKGWFLFFWEKEYEKIIRSYFDDNAASYRFFGLCGNRRKKRKHRHGLQNNDASCDFYADRLSLRCPEKISMVYRSVCIHCRSKCRLFFPCDFFNA